MSDLPNQEELKTRPRRPSEKGVACDRTRRLIRTVDGTSQKYLWDGKLRVVGLLDDAGNVAAESICGPSPNAPEYMVTASGTYRMVKDPLGSVRLVNCVVIHARV